MLLVLKTGASFSTNQIQTLTQSWFGHPRFPAFNQSARFYFEISLANDDVNLTFAPIGYCYYLGFSFSKLD